MWFIPETESEIQAAIDSGLEESSIFDAKRDLGNNNKEIAKDIASMANDGGTLLYGLGEDTQGRPSVLCPFDLKGIPERINNIVQTGIQEPPHIVINKIWSDTDSDKGYILVIIPPSIRAPHLVIIKNENRFYGRTATGCAPLTEGEIARLYYRRSQVQHNQQQLLQNLPTNFNISHEDHAGYLYIGVWPVYPSESLLRPILKANQMNMPFWRDIIRQSRAEPTIKSGLSKYLQEPQHIIHTIKGQKLLLDMDDRLNRLPHQILDIHLTNNGEGFFVSGAATTQFPERGKSIFLAERAIAGLTIQFLRFMGILYQRAGYLSSVDVGVRLIGIHGASSEILNVPMHMPTPLRPLDDEYEQSTQVSALILEKDTPRISEELLENLFQAVTQGQYTPFLK